MTWYDQRTPNMLNWIIVGNHGNQTAEVEIYIAGELKGSYQVPVGSRVTPTFPGVMDGPVRVVSTNNQPLSVSQRVHLGSAFNETAAKSAASLTTSYYFTWYDQQTSGMYTWVLIGNQGSQTAQVDVLVAGQLKGHFQIPAGARVTPNFPGVMNGPVEVVSTNGQPLIVSQRSHYWGSFEEALGARPDELTSNQWFAWYDYATPGMITWILVGNQGGSAATVDIKIAGTLVGRYTVAAGERITPTFPGQLNGPVEVAGSPGSQLIVSQRTHYYGSFDEVRGRALN